MLLHALLLGLQFDGEGRGWMGLGISPPRRVQVTDLRVTLVRPPVALETEASMPPPDERISVVARAPTSADLFSAVQVPSALESPRAIETAPKETLPLKLSRTLSPPAPAAIASADSAPAPIQPPSATAPPKLASAPEP
ncbi:MAG: hypothetical protein JNJ55_12785, partial [Betaproteobacteria bacterium]|nr:hypothetical protein [Betaproteobacteria bacterium]